MTAAAPEPRFDLVFRRGEDRFQSERDWLKSWHSFSFAGHDDPAWRGFGPLLVINDDQIAPGQGFGMHPHRDMEIITVMVEGALRHRDSMGNSGTLLADDVQRMSAGSGLIHSEMNPCHQSCRFLQIWIEPSALGLAPSYEQRPFVVGADWTALIDPSGTSGAMAIGRPVRIWRARPNADQALAVSLDPKARGWLQLIEGSLQAEGAPLLQRDDGLGFAPTAITSLRAGPTGADVLLFELR